MSETSSIKPSGSSTDAGPFHAAEIAVQQRAGVTDEADRSGRRGIRRYMPEQHRQFFAEQPFMVFGGVDAGGQPWATLRVGAPGFVSSPDARTLRIEGGALSGDPLADSWREGALIGGLGLQPHTRRRNRVNGRVSSVNGDVVTLEVLQSFGNCAKYIQGRAPEFISRGSAGAPPEVEHATELNATDRALLARADTFFIASANLANEANLARGVDVSHRGGMPGFVRIDDANTLTTPDFSGNRFFNTLGNLTHDPRAGLLFVDFESGDLLYVAARAEIIWEGPELVEFPLAERLVRFRITEVRRSRAVLPFRWSAVDYAPQFPALKPAREFDSSVWRKLRIAAVHDETPSIRSFYMESIDDTPLAPFEPGQFLPIRVPVEGASTPIVRTYTLSDASDARRYRISVKRQGAASSWLHDHLAAGMHIETMAPRGAFTYDRSTTRAAVFISAGIGITPMLAMLQQAIAARTTNTQTKPLYFFHGARNDSERPFSAYLKELADRHADVSMHLFDSESNAVIDSMSSSGRVSIAALKRLLPFDDYDFYLCGPDAFMRDLYEGLRALNVADERIRFEAFGPASVKRTPDAVASTTATQPNDESSNTARQPADAVPVTFSRTQRTMQWLPKNGTLLEFAEACGIDAPSSCRSGICGTCSTRVLQGSVAYDGPTEADIASGHALICMSRPLADENGSAQALTLDL
ncbi:MULTISPECIES: pyridoxamine 5'-phosphate oxidase family protein [Paraburkholderia]|uniref:pyridoxamine 5'-phosphate oxidase family protein n=1 Tax=Paraburkholderia TaxID=1822464 RepID=UPI00225998FD|nr:MULTISPECIES: pyridoxamine 5'-phosphate oxidase family protein [Paraburkholderia]MCX4163034.1 pyridoxamine 5'-phosphate oxidase family protein [Paraburkholderia megapolitana]MDN7158530.1 pyridoxamine 5'-phosphate oxidase family protein [Paraburkholderia sp. CHISQ3]MDQ6495577.1 pyridoxamine 5'-phosphate oxidase family protein [Paraburkholderia megapolitana]